MLLKRFIFLAAGVLLFIFAFILHFKIAQMQLEDRFRQERVKFGVDGVVLTAATTTPGADVNPIIVSNPPVTAPSTANPAPTPAADAAATDDTNIIIGPVPPPPNSSTPDNAPAPSAPDSNSAPATPPSSTMNDPRARRSPFLVLASYRPSDGREMQIAENEPASNAVPSPASPATPDMSPSPATSGTNAEAAPARPVPVEASVIVLGYHQFMAAGESSKNIYKMRQDTFESEMKYLHDNGYHVVPLSDVIRFIKHEIGLPPGSVAVTIDDGYKSAIVYAAPVLKKYGYPWTYFVYPDFITVNESKGAASWNDLRALQAEGVDIESHTMTHPFLTHHRQKIKGVWHDLSPQEYDQWLTNETAGAKELLEQKLGKTITCLAYPYGDYNKEVEAKVIASGYEAIFTVADNPVHNTTDIHSIGRYVITQPVEKDFAAYLRQGALGIADADPAPGATTSNPRPVITAVIGYAGNLDPNAIETTVRDYGVVRHDFDPKTSTIRLYLPRDLIQPTVLVNIRVKDAQTGQIMVANWHFNYEAAGTTASIHPPISPTTNAPATNSAPGISATTNAPATPQAGPAIKSER